MGENAKWDFQKIKIERLSQTSTDRSDLCAKDLCESRSSFLWPLFLFRFSTQRLFQASSDAQTQDCVKFKGQQGWHDIHFIHFPFWKLLELRIQSFQEVLAEIRVFWRVVSFCTQHAQAYQRWHNTDDDGMILWEVAGRTSANEPTSKTKYELSYHMIILICVQVICISVTDWVRNFTFEIKTSFSQFSQDQ